MPNAGKADKDTFFLPFKQLPSQMPKMCSSDSGAIRYTQGVHNTVVKS